MRVTPGGSSFRRYNPSDHPVTGNKIASGSTHSSPSKSPQKSGVYCYYSDSASDSDSDVEPDRESEPSPSIDENQNINQRIAEEITPSNNSNQLIKEHEFKMRPFLPPPMTDLSNHLTNTHLENEELELNILASSESKLALQSQQKLSSESSTLYDLYSKIGQMELEFQTRMESFTSSRKEHMQLSHMNDIETISLIENQMRKTALEEEKRKFLNQLDSTINQPSHVPLNYNETVRILSKFTSRMKDESLNSKYSIVFELTKEEEKQVKKYEAFVDDCYSILKQLKQYTQQLQPFVSNERSDLSSLNENEGKNLQENLQSLSTILKNEVIVNRLRKGGDKIVLSSDQMMAKINSLVNKPKESKPTPTTMNSSTTSTSNTAPKKTTTTTATTTTTRQTTNRGEEFDILLSEGAEDDSISTEKLNLHQWIQTLLTEYNQVIGRTSRENNPFLTLLEDCLNQLYALFQLSDEERTTSRLINDISMIEQSLKTASNLPSPSTTISSVQWFLLSIYNFLLNCAIRADSEEKILMLGHISGAICRVGGRTSAKILYAYLCSSAIESTNANPSDFQSEIAPPNVSSNLFTPIAFNSQYKKRLILFYATQMGSTNSPTSSRVDLTSGWIWLIRCSAMISRYIHNNQPQLLNELCSILRGYLRFIGSTLQLTYPTKFISLMRIIQSLLSSFRSSQSNSNQLTDVNDLQTMLDTSLQSGVFPCVLFKQKDSYIIYALGVIKSLMKVKKDSDALDSDKSPEKKQIKSILEVAAIPSPFNLLSSDPESQNRALHDLSEHISRAVSFQDGSLLWYVLYKVTKESIENCQTPHFSVSGHAQFLSTLICRLCESFPNLSELYRMQFYKACSFTIPQLYIDGEGDDMLVNLGFQRRKDKEGKISFEAPAKWLSRMNKVIGTFASVIVHPSNNPLNHTDGWLWLSKIVNNIISKPGEAPPFTAKILDTFLRVVSPVMLQEYGPYFVSVLRMIEEKVLPKLTENFNFVQAHSHKEQLRDFLRNFLGSNGQTCLPVLNDM